MTKRKSKLKVSSIAKVRGKNLENENFTKESIVKKRTLRKRGKVEIIKNESEAVNVMGKEKSDLSHTNEYIKASIQEKDVEAGISDRTGIRSTIGKPQAVESECHKQSPKNGYNCITKIEDMSHESFRCDGLGSKSINENHNDSEKSHTTYTKRTLRKRKYVDYGGCEDSGNGEHKKKRALLKPDICGTSTRKGAQKIHKVHSRPVCGDSNVVFDKNCFNGNQMNSSKDGDSDSEDNFVDDCKEPSDYLDFERMCMKIESNVGTSKDTGQNSEMPTVNKENQDILKMLMENETSPEINELKCDSNSDDNWEKVSPSKKNIPKIKNPKTIELSKNCDILENLQNQNKLQSKKRNKKRKVSGDSDFEIDSQPENLKKSGTKKVRSDSGKLKSSQKVQLTVAEKEIQRFTNRCLKDRDSCLEQCTLVLGVAFLCNIVKSTKSTIIFAVLLSVIPKKLHSFQLDHIERHITSLSDWYKDTFILDKNSKDEIGFSNRFLIMRHITSQRTTFEHIYVAVFYCILQIFELDVRFVGSLYVPSSEKVSKNNKQSSNHTSYNPTYWLEVKNGEKLLVVDVVNDVIYVDAFDENRYEKPPCYVVAVTPELAILDCTPKYSFKWSEIHRKARMLNFSFWDNFIADQPKHLLILKEHSSFMKQIMIDRGFPKSLSGFKHNLVFALEKDNLKIEAIYPKDAPVLGSFKSHNIYSRDNVKSLKQIIVIKKEGRALRDGEIPFKIVKNKIIYDRWPGDDRWKDNPLYGDWQTEWYKAPTAENGVVPRNEFGNVELFQPWMLPKGTKHVDLAGSYALARRLNINAAHAVVGFEFPRCRAVPVMRGVVVCEEYAETLENAWVEYNALQVQRAEVRDKKF